MIFFSISIWMKSALQIFRLGCTWSGCVLFLCGAWRVPLDLENYLRLNSIWHFLTYLGVIVLRGFFVWYFYVLPLCLRLAHSKGLNCLGLLPSIPPPPLIFTWRRKQIPLSKRSNFNLLAFLYQTMEKVHKLNNSECKPSSESFSIYSMCQFSRNIICFCYTKYAPCLHLSLIEGCVVCLD